MVPAATRLGNWLRAPAPSIAAEREGHASPELLVEITALEGQVAQREWTLTVAGTSTGTLAPVDADDSLGCVRGLAYGLACVVPFWGLVIASAWLAF